MPGPVRAPSSVDAVERAAAELEGATAEEILGWADKTFGQGLVVTSSMQDSVLVHVASKVRPGITVLFLDTGYHFAETIGTRDAVEATYPITLIDVRPKQTVAEQDAEHGVALHDRDPDLCCWMRKVEPLQDALAPYTAWATGLRRADSPDRSDVPVVGWDGDRRRVKVNPLASWTDDDVDAYIEEHGLLVNPLLYDGYPSIGCAPCTRRVAHGDDVRAGRWAGKQKTECGIHVPDAS